MIRNGECGVGCGRVVNPPVMCSVEYDINLEQCGDSLGVTAAQALSMPYCAKDNAGDCDKVCSMTNMRKFAKGVTLANTMTAMSKDMLKTGYERFENDDYPDYSSTSCAHPDQCVAGQNMKDVVNCGFIKVIATEIYSPLCLSLLPGFASVATAALVFMWFGIVSFFVLVWGFKRWQRPYLELSSKALKEAQDTMDTHEDVDTEESTQRAGLVIRCSPHNLEEGSWLVTGDGMPYVVQDRQLDATYGQSLLVDPTQESAIEMQEIRQQKTSAGEDEVTLTFGEVTVPQKRDAPTYA
jgi:hypothetical protein